MSDHATEQVFQAQIVGGKRQLTIPAKMMKQLGLKPGDFLQFTIRGKEIIRTAPCKVIPIDALPEEALRKIEQSAREIVAGRSTIFVSPAAVHGEPTDSDTARAGAVELEEIVDT